MDRALPLWWQKGADRIHGGFHEAIELSGEPLALPHRTRSIARQAYSFCEAGRLGWAGPWREAAQHALDYFCRHFITAEGFAVSVVDLDGRIRNDGQVRRSVRQCREQATSFRRNIPVKLLWSNR